MTPRLKPPRQRRGRALARDSAPWAFQWEPRALPRGFTRHRYSLRQRLDGIAGGLLLLVTLSGCVSLWLVQRQWRDTMVLQALHEQERLIGDWIRASDGVVVERFQPPVADPARVRSIQEGLSRLTRTLRTLEHGGELMVNDQRLRHLEPIRDARILHYLNTAIGWLQLYQQRVDELVGGGEAMNAETLKALQQDLIHYGWELRASIQQLASGAESRLLAAVVRASQLQLGWMCLGILLFLLSVLLYRRFVTLPLHRMVDGIDAMQRTGRLVKLPVLHRDELGVVAEGFNRLAEQVEEQKQRLREHIVELQRVNAEFERLANIKDEFLQSVNHQLRTPLTALVEGLELLRDGAMGTLTIDQLGLTRMLQENAQRLERLIDEALDLTLLKSGRRPLDRKSDDLAAVLRQVQQRWGAAVDGKTVRLSCGELPPVFMDALAVREVMDHLLRNALRHAPKSSAVTVQARAIDPASQSPDVPPGVRDVAPHRGALDGPPRVGEVGLHGMVEVTVRDHGPGMSREQLAQLFQPFVHIQTPHAPGSEGSGLGLALCRQLVERHRGSIRADSVEGQGLTVTFTLPPASPQFVFEDACRCAQEDAECEHGRFGLLLVAPMSPPVGPETLSRAEAVLRQNAHRGDRFVWLEAQALVIVAVTDAPGLEAMARRLRGVMDQAGLTAVGLSWALFPSDGDRPGALLSSARQRFTTGEAGLPAGQAGLAVGPAPAYARMARMPCRNPTRLRKA